VQHAVVVGRADGARVEDGAVDRERAVVDVLAGGERSEMSR
jgi:hypothetical protein